MFNFDNSNCILLENGYFNEKDYQHIYTLCMESPKKKVTETFNSRPAATRRMYELCDKYHLSIKKVWDDKHFKTYKTYEGATFYINHI